MINLLLQSAIRYSDKEWYVFPCREKPSEPFLNKKGKEKILREKTPYTINGLNDATLDKSKIEEWWIKHPLAMIAVNCGLSNLFVLDIDTKHGRNGIDTFMNLGVDDSNALHSLTPSGGLHVVFSGKGKTTTSPLTGLDTRGEGGYFIVPPSKVLFGDTVGNYVAVDDWNRIPPMFPDDLLVKLDLNKANKKEPKTIEHVLSHSQKVLRAKDALDKIPQYMCDSYSDWIRVGMSLRSLGDDGLILWRDWSENSPKYKEFECEEKWDTFDPREITLGTLFYLAAGNP
jgi:hypothetical protein